MLPPGHIAGGFLAAKALLHFTHPAVSVTQYNQLLLWGIFFGFAPDLDIFYLFLKSGGLKADPEKGDHRQYFGHVPILWLIAGLLIFFLSQSAFYKTFGLMVWVGSWTHFVLDSIQYGIMWLWPFDKKVHALIKVNSAGLDGKLHKAAKLPFFKYWITFVKEWSSYFRVTLISELILIVIALIIYFK